MRTNRAIANAELALPSKPRQTLQVRPHSLRYYDWTVGANNYFADFGGPLYALEYGADLGDAVRRADRLGMSGDFSDLRQLHLDDLLAREDSQ